MTESRRYRMFIDGGGMDASDCKIASALAAGGVFDRGRRRGHADRAGRPRRSVLGRHLSGYEARGTDDLAVRKPLYSEIQKILIEDIPNVPLFFAVEYGATGKNVHGFEWIADQIPRFRELWKDK